MKLAYIMSRFPKITETFVLREMVQVLDRGVDLEVHPLIHYRQDVQHPDVERLRSRVHYTSLLSPALWLANLLYLFTRPRRYVGLLAELVRGTWGDAEFLLKHLAILPLAAHMARRMRRHGVERVHAHFATFPAAAALVIRRLEGIPFSFTAHGSDIHVRQRMLRRKVLAAEFAVMISDYNRRFVMETCGHDLEDRLVVVHCGIRPERYPEADPAGPPEEPCTILCVASMRPVKGHEHLVEACARLRDDGVEFTCHLLGDGPRRDEVQQMVRRADLQDRVRLHGAVPEDEVARWMAASDVLALTSVHTGHGSREGIPVVLMEAMATGLAVVASDLSGIPELVEHERTGLLVPPGDPAAIAGALERLRRDPELRRRLGRAGREKVAREFNLHRTVDRLLDLWGAGRQG